MKNEISAKLIKSLEKQGFELNIPSYDSNDDLIIEILRKKNSRLELSLPIIYLNEFNYKHIIARLKDHHELILTFKDSIIISIKLYEKFMKNLDYKIYLIKPYNYIIDIIKKNKLSKKINLLNYDYFEKQFSMFLRKKIIDKNKDIKEQSQLRSQSSLNSDLRTIFSDGKINIMDKIFNYESLTKSEWNYYYRSIKPFIKAILNTDLQNFMSSIEKTKKILMK